MLKVDIPGRGSLELNYLLLDYNGTLAVDGHLLASVADLIRQLAACLEIRILTADTFGLVRTACADLPVDIQIVSPVEGGLDKERITKQLGAHQVVSIGNGYNDCLMLRESALGILVIGAEGCSAQSLISADVVVNNIDQALELLLHPQRLVATLRT